MASIFKRAAKTVIYSPAAERVLHAIHGSRPRILTYHRFPQSAIENFERQCAYLRRAYSPISLDQLLEAIRDGRPLPARSLAVTIDDGYRDVYERGAPVLRRYGIPATVFAVSRFLDGGFWLWWDAILYAFLNSPLPFADIELPGCGPLRVALGGPGERTSLAGRISVFLARRDNSEACNWRRHIAEQLQVSIPECPVAPYDAISWDEARKLGSDGITFGSHTVNHYVIGTLPSVDSRRVEIFDSKKRMEQMLDRRLDHFCFPNGGIGDFSHADVALVKEAGYSSSATTMLGLLYPEADVFQLPRINVDATMDLAVFRMKIAGLFQHAGAVNLPGRTREV
jgi:peptidoglycan/xylan/chitin deacetylase (PgdA/CDA1 family)